MLTPDYLKKFQSEYLGYVDELNTQIVSDIARRIIKTGRVTDTAEWQIRMAQNSGLVLDDIVADVSKFTKYSEPQIRNMFKDAGVISLKNDASPLLKAGIMTDLKMSDAMSNLLLANAKKTIGDATNLSLTTASKGSELFRQEVNSAIMKVQSGAYTPEQALRQAVKNAASQGARVSYQSGATGSLDSAIRMCIQTGVNQTCGTLTEMFAEDNGVEFYETTAHPGAREEHEPWQGRVFQIEGSSHGYENFYAATGYGTGEGLCGWNCRHSFFPFWPGISVRAYSSSKLESLSEANVHWNGGLITQYEASQMQRKQERQIRQSKRILSAYNAAMDEAESQELKDSIYEDFKAESKKLKAREKAYKEFSKKTGISGDNARLQVHAAWHNGKVVEYGRSTAQKAVWAAKK